VRDLPDLTLLAPAQITIYNKKIVDHTVTADGISGNLADDFAHWQAIRPSRPLKIRFVEPNFEGLE
jgi:hypothetical protein